MATQLPVSRYATPGQATAAQNADVRAGNIANQGGTTDQSGTTASTGSTTGSNNTTGTSHTTQGTDSTTTTQNMSGSSMAALELLIQQLLGGGSQAQANARGQRQQEINIDQGSRAGYTRDTAFADAQGLMAQTMRQTLEKLLPSINRGAEGAGASAGSMRALLTQQAASQAAEAASAQGLNAAVQYGNVNAGFSSILERLTQPDNTTEQNLLSALNVARGAVTTSHTSGTQTSDTDSTQQQQTQQNTQQNQTQQQTSATRPTGSSGVTAPGNTISGPGDVGGLVSYGPTQTAPAGTAGTSIDFVTQLNDLAGSRNSGWSNGFTF